VEMTVFDKSIHHLAIAKCRQGRLNFVCAHAGSILASKLNRQFVCAPGDFFFILILPCGEHTSKHSVNHWRSQIIHPLSHLRAHKFRSFPAAVLFVKFIVRTTGKIMGINNVYFLCVGEGGRANNIHSAAAFIW